MNKGFFARALTNKHEYFLSFAPGRIEFLGNHLDYNGGTVLGMAVNAGISCLGIPANDNLITMTSEGLEDAVLLGQINCIEKQTGKYKWANYPLGVLQELQKRNLAPTKGFHLYYTSNLPTAVGLSSSAALELATAVTLLQLAGKEVSPGTLARICRDAENKFVGMPCGILDQGTSAFGKNNSLVKIDCREETYESVDLPQNTQAWIFDTGIKHDLVDSLYSVRHQECKDALSIIQDKGSDITCLSMIEKEVLKDADLKEKLFKRATHVCDEQARVNQFCKGLESGMPPESLGKLLQESHQSSSQYFENSCEELDYLAGLLNGHRNVHGARLTGGGFGGAVMAWTQDLFNATEAQAISDEFQKRFDRKSRFYRFLPSNGARKETL
jgi:galactokinase